MNRRLLVFATWAISSSAFGLGAVAPDQPVSFLGRFSSMEYTEEHQYGFEVTLWNAGDVVLGHFTHAEGLAGDLPVGVLEQAVYHPPSGDLSFEAKRAFGSHYCAEHNGVPARLLYQFVGTLSTEAIVGTMTILDALHEHRLVEAQAVELKRIRPDGDVHREPIPHAQWVQESPSVPGW